MSIKKVRLVVNTNTNIRYLTAIPANYTIERTIPLLIHKYKTVISENMGSDHDLLEGSNILQITKKGCLIAKD